MKLVLAVRRFPLALLAVAGLAGCGAENTVEPPPPPSTTPGPVTTTTTTTTTTVPAGPAAGKCDHLQPGPVMRFAITPREIREDGVQAEHMRVKAKPGFDEVWCVNKDKELRLDLNSNQRNAAGKECCWENDPEWTVSDPEKVVDSAAPVPNTNGFNYRLRINTHGERATVAIQGKLDGKESFPWQSNSGYTQGPLYIVAMSANEIERDCHCYFKGNGIYEGDRCNK